MGIQTAGREAARFAAVLLLMIAWLPSAMAIEEPSYDVVATTDFYELRRYDAYLVAETEVEGNLSSSGRRAFRVLADYIFGNNQASQKMAMTAPVESTPSDGVRMAMTAPVESRESTNTSDRYVYGFVMEKKYTLDTLPRPNNPDIHIREVPARTVAVHRFSGRWSPSRLQKIEATLLEAVANDGLTAVGSPTLARFNGPMTPWFLRRNEIQVEVDAAD